MAAGLGRRAETFFAFDFFFDEWALEIDELLDAVQGESDVAPTTRRRPLYPSITRPAVRTPAPTVAAIARADFPIVANMLCPFLSEPKKP